jgi:DNA-binding beta-propeller fold protein YncE
MKILITNILYFFLTLALTAQSQVAVKAASDKDDPYIRWIANVPAVNSHDSTGFFEKVFNFITGNDPVVYNNPVNIFATGTQKYWIVNQGSGTILQYLNGKTMLVPAFKKEKKIFPSMVGICAMKPDGILFTDSRLNKVLFLAGDGKKYRTFNDTNTLARPTGVAYSEKHDEVWVVETGSHRISVFTGKGERKKTIGRRGNGPLEFNFPTYIWIDSSGKVYIVDSMNFRVQVLSPEGDYVTSFGKQGDATGSFARPRGIATDSHGNIYVVDALFDVVQIFDISGNLLYYFGTHGSGKNQFWMPSGIFIDKSDYIYVADSYNSRVQIFQLVKNGEK